MKRGRPEPSSDLWDFVLDMDWPRVVQHARSEPQDANFLEGHWHETPLYLTCQLDAPVDALRAVIEAYPESVQIASRENHDLPIHLACRYQADTEILEALLKDYPETATETTKWGKTPIMTLWDFRKNEMTNASAVQLNDDDDFWKKVFVLLRAAARSHSMNSDQCDGIDCSKMDDTGSNIPDVHGSKINSSVPSAEQEERFFFVHAAVSLGSKGCPIEVLSHAIEKHPKEVLQRDQRGHLPLHILIQKISWSKHRRRRLKPKEKSFLTCLLKSHPGSARERIYDDHNRYPLHSALANGHTWSHGVANIFLAAPEVLMVRDPSTGLFPFQLAGVPITEDTAFDMDNLETVYQLLRARPDVINYLQLSAKRGGRSKLTDSTIGNAKRTSKGMFLITFAKRLYDALPGMG